MKVTAWRSVPVRSIASTLLASVGAAPRQASRGSSSAISLPREPPGPPSADDVPVRLAADRQGLGRGVPPVIAAQRLEMPVVRSRGRQDAPLAEPVPSGRDERPALHYDSSRQNCAATQPMARNRPPCLSPGSRAHREGERGQHEAAISQFADRVEPTAQGRSVRALNSVSLGRGEQGEHDCQDLRRPRRAPG